MASGGGTATGIVIEPASVDFGVLTPQRPWVDAKVTAAWNGARWPESITRNQGDDWWRVIDSASPASSCVVFHLRAAAHSRGPTGPHHAQFTVTVNDTVLTVKLSADFQGDFSTIAEPNFEPPASRRAPGRLTIAVKKYQALLDMILLGLVGVAFLVFAGTMAYSAYGERAQSGQFLSAPRCAANVAPTGDCSAWQTRTVSYVSNPKGAMSIDLDGGLHVSYSGDRGWIGGLTAGESVRVLVWEGSAQALRDPEGGVFYSDDSVLDEGKANISAATGLSVLGVLIMVYAFVMSPWCKRRRPRYLPLAFVLGDVGVSGAVGAGIIQATDSVDRGVTIGVVLFCVIGVAAAVVTRLTQARARFL